MKRFAVIGILMLLTLAVLTYLLLDDRSADTKDMNEAEPSEALYNDLIRAAAPGSAQRDKVEAAVQPNAEEQVRYSAKSGAGTQFELDLGEIGYVDVYSILQDRDPYSIVALVQQHRAYTGAGELLELEIESTGGTPQRYNARFVQVIEGAPTEARGSVFFDSSGKVSTVYGSLFDTQEAGTGNVVIAQAEAEAIALEAARRFSERRGAGVAERGGTLKMEASSGQLRYVIDPELGDELRAEWRVPVSIYGPPFSVEVLVAAETGNVISVKSLIEPAAASTGCSRLTFRVCDATTMTKNSRSSCGVGPFDGGTPIIDGENCVAQTGDTDKCNQDRYKDTMEEANKIRDYIENIGGTAKEDYLEGVGGDDCKVDILINVDTDLMERVQGQPADGQYDSVHDAILIREDYRDSNDGDFVQPVFNESLIVHEVLHAVTNGTGQVEHGLVDGMEALKVGADTPSNWTYGKKDFTKEQAIDGRDTHSVVGNTVYRIYKRIRQMQKTRRADDVAKEVFRFALEVDREQATSLASFRQALVRVANTKFPATFQQAVAVVLVGMGINKLPLNTVPETILRFTEAKLRALAAAHPNDVTIGDAAEEALRRLKERLGLREDEPLRF